MRLTIINQFYPPDLAPTGNLAASVAEHRATLGDQVTVITSMGGYVPESAVGQSTERTNPRVIRLWTPRLGKASTLNRILDYSSYYLFAFIRTLTLPPQDMIISLTTPPFIAWAGVFHRWIHAKTRLVLWNMDCYPEVAERAGVIRPGGWISRFMRWLNRGLFRRLDHLIPLDQAMERLLLGQYTPEGKLLPSTVIHNWEPENEFPANVQPPPWEGVETHGLADRFVVLYLGNAGVGHRFETILEAAEMMRDEQVLFLFVGGGAKWSHLHNAREKRGLENLVLIRYVPKVDTPMVMAAADCALITLRESYVGVISPSKMHSNLAMGLPILYIGPEGGNVDEAISIHQCGVSLRHGDAQGVVHFIRDLMEDPAKLQRLRDQARRAFEVAYSDRQALPKMDRVLDGLIPDE